jgi:hypothetical protein
MTNIFIDISILLEPVEIIQVFSHPHDMGAHAHNRSKLSKAG